MPSPRDERLKGYRALRDRARRQPENFASFLGELHTFLKELYEVAARTDENIDCFEKALSDLCADHGIVGWQDLIGEDQQRQFFRDAHDPDVQRVIAFWAELDEPLEF